LSADISAVYLDRNFVGAVRTGDVIEKRLPVALFQLEVLHVKTRFLTEFLIVTRSCYNRLDAAQSNITIGGNIVFRRFFQA
jgi:hypothetical protein